MMRTALVAVLVSVTQCACSHQVSNQVLGYVQDNEPAAKAPGEQQAETGVANINLSGTYKSIRHVVTTNEPVNLLIQKGGDGDGKKTQQLTHNFQAYFVPEPAAEKPTRTVEVQFSDPLVYLGDISYIWVWGTHPGVKTKKLIAVNPGSSYYVRVMKDKDWVVNVGSGNVNVWVPPSTWPTGAPSVLVPTGHYVEVTGVGQNLVAVPYAGTEVDFWLKSL